MRTFATILCLLIFANSKTFAAQNYLSTLAEAKYCSNTNLTMYFSKDATESCFLVFSPNKSKITVKFNNKLLQLIKQSRGIYQSKDRKIKISFKSKIVSEHDPEKDCAGEGLCNIDGYEGNLVLETPRGKENYPISYWRGDVPN